MERQYKQIVVHTDRYRITGSLLLPPDGYRSRLSDYLNAPERTFLALTDVEIVPLDGTAAIEQRRFVALALSHIVLAMPGGDSADGEELAE